MTEETVCPGCGKDLPSEKGMRIHYGRKDDEHHEGSISKEDVECESCGFEFTDYEIHERKYCKECHLNQEQCDEETYRKISEANEGMSIDVDRSGENNPMYGVTGKDNPNYGRDVSDETRKKLSESNSGENATWYGVTGEDHPTHGREHTEKDKQKISDAVSGENHGNWNGAAVTPEMRRKLSESKRGKKNPNWNGEAWTEESVEKMKESRSGYSHSDETRRKISKSKMGEKNPNYGKTGEDNPMYGSPPPSPDPIEVEETGHTVRSSWEEEIDKMLYNHDIDYEYEPKRFEFESVEKTYLPDFMVGNKVVEVKGWADEKSIGRSKLFMREYPGYEYIVVGDEMSCDAHIKWEDREDVIEVCNGL